MSQQARLCYGRLQHICLLSTQSELKLSTNLDLNKDRSRETRRLDHRTHESIHQIRNMSLRPRLRNCRRGNRRVSRRRQKSHHHRGTRQQKVILPWRSRVHGGFHMYTVRKAYSCSPLGRYIWSTMLDMHSGRKGHGAS